MSHFLKFFTKVETPCGRFCPEKSIVTALLSELNGIWRFAVFLQKSWPLATGRCPQQMTAIQSISFLARSILTYSKKVLCYNRHPVNVASHKIRLALHRIKFMIEPPLFLSPVHSHQKQLTHCPAVHYLRSDLFFFLKYDPLRRFSLKV